jgi:hypothetical protein
LLTRGEGRVNIRLDPLLNLREWHLRSSCNFLLVDEGELPSQFIDLLLKIVEIVLLDGFLGFLVLLIEVQFQLSSKLIHFRFSTIGQVGVLPKFADVSPKLKD